MTLPDPDPITPTEYDAIISNLGLDPDLTLQVVFSEYSIFAQVVALDSNGRLMRNSPTDVIQTVEVPVTS